VKFVKATADFSNEERSLEPEFQSEYRKKNGGDKRTVRTGGRWPSTARRTPRGASTPGPGRRNVARKAVFIPEKPLQFPKGAVLLFQPRSRTTAATTRTTIRTTTSAASG
jgi:hypothetical protein